MLVSAKQLWSLVVQSPPRFHIFHISAFRTVNADKLRNRSVLDAVDIVARAFDRINPKFALKFVW
jgi:hypothetical protein